MIYMSVKKRKRKKQKFSKKTLDKLKYMGYNSKALAGVAESADAHV